MAQRVYERVCNAEEADLTIVMIHGAGYTAQTWHWLSQELSNFKEVHRLVTFDLRGHGQSDAPVDNDYSLDSMVEDTLLILEPYDKILLIGHSLGGSIATRLATCKSVMGLVVIDIVEGVALASLERMPALLDRRPPSFPSEQAIVEWAVAEGIARNTDIARISTLSQYRLQENVWIPRIDLRLTAPYWREWFTGLSQAFANLNCPRILCLAQRDYLDPTLMMAQMRGAFQLEVILDTGHAIQEEQPHQLALLIHEFIQRQATIERINRDYYSRINADQSADR